MALHRQLVAGSALQYGLWRETIPAGRIIVPRYKMFRVFSLAGIASSNPAGAWFLVCRSGRGLCEGPILRPGESCPMCVRGLCEGPIPRPGESCPMCVRGLCEGPIPRPGESCRISLRRADPSSRGVLSDVCERSLRRADQSSKGVLSDVCEVSSKGRYLVQGSPVGCVSGKGRSLVQGSPVGYLCEGPIHRPGESCQMCVRSLRRSDPSSRGSPVRCVYD